MCIAQFISVVNLHVIKFSLIVLNEFSQGLTNYFGKDNYVLKSIIRKKYKEINSFTKKCN